MAAIFRTAEYYFPVYTRHVFENNLIQHTVVIPILVCLNCYKDKTRALSVQFQVTLPSLTNPGTMTDLTLFADIFWLVFFRWVNNRTLMLFRLRGWPFVACGECKWWGRLDWCTKSLARHSQCEARIRVRWQLHVFTNRRLSNRC